LIKPEKPEPLMCIKQFSKKYSRTHNLFLLLFSFQRPNPLAASFPARCDRSETIPKPLSSVNIFFSAANLFSRGNQLRFPAAPPNESRL
jgi:hypothetical protein